MLDNMSPPLPWGEGVPDGRLSLCPGLRLGREKARVRRWHLLIQRELDGTK